MENYPRIQLRTVKELMEGKGIERPSTVAVTDETFKKRWNHFLVASILTCWFTGCFCLELWPSSNAPWLPPQFLPSLRHSFCVWLS
jgi:hypothetical protein